MKRSLLILLFPLFLASPLLCEDLEAAELVVPTNYAGIQEAINAALAGDVVLVEPGTYSGPITLKISVSLRGRETARTFITGGSAGTAIIASNVTGVSIKNFTFTQASTVFAVTEAEVTITNNIFSLGNAGTAISVQNTAAAAPQIINNTFYQNATAIASNMNLTIKNNIFFGNTTDISPNTLAPATITYNAFSAAAPSAPVLGTTNLMGTDPLFASPSTNDFHLKSGSPCIDAGDSAVTDFIDATRSDMGAYGGSTNQDSIPVRVTGLSVTATTANSITLTWNEDQSYLVAADNAAVPKNPRGYRVWYGSTASGSYTGTDAGGSALPSPIKLDLRTVTVPPYTIDTLSPSSLAPSAPPALAQPAPGNQTLELAWTAVTGATGYTVHYGIATTAENALAVGNVLSYTLQGLTNGQTYKIAVSAFAQSTYYLAVTAYDNTGAALSTSTPGTSHESAYSSEVPVPIGAALSSGLSNEVSDFPEAVSAYPNLPDKGCFIATAAYGFYSAPQVQALRKFRDAYLLTNAPGKAFVRWYYRYGPAAARFIDKHPLLKPVVRTALLPAIAGAMFMTGTPEATKAIIAASLICGIGWFLYGRTLRRRGDRR